MLNKQDCARLCLVYSRFLAALLCSTGVFVSVVSGLNKQDLRCGALYRFKGCYKLLLASISSLPHLSQVRHGVQRKIDQTFLAT